jgi:hypothetical protein
MEKREVIGLCYKYEVGKDSSPARTVATEIVDDDEGEWEGDAVDTITDSGGTDSDGYASF